MQVRVGVGARGWLRERDRVPELQNGRTFSGHTAMARGNRPSRVPAWGHPKASAMMQFATDEPFVRSPDERFGTARYAKDSFVIPEPLQWKGKGRDCAHPCSPSIPIMSTAVLARATRSDLFLRRGFLLVGSDRSALRHYGTRASRLAVSPMPWRSLVGFAGVGLA